MVLKIILILLSTAAVIINWKTKDDLIEMMCEEIEMLNEQLFFIKNALNVSNQEHEKLREKCAKFEYEYAAAKKRIKEAHNKQSW